MKVLTIIFQSPTFAPGQNERYQGIPWQQNSQEDSCLYKLHFSNYTFFSMFSEVLCITFLEYKKFKYSI